MMTTWINITRKFVIIANKDEQLIEHERIEVPNSSFNEKLDFILAPSLQDAILKPYGSNPNGWPK
jgi:hypothetical protein